MKFTKRHESQIREYLKKAGSTGVLPVDEWTSGSGRFTRNRALPPFTQRFERKEYPNARPPHGAPERKAFEFFRQHPKRKVCLVMDVEALGAFLFASARGKEF